LKMFNKKQELTYGGRSFKTPPKDDSDVPFLQAAAEGGVQYIITGDPHLLALDGRYPYLIVSPAEFLKKN
jgi:predicted nucleic acid-binding protein